MRVFSCSRDSSGNLTPHCYHSTQRLRLASERHKCTLRAAPWELLRNHQKKISNTSSHQGSSQWRYQLWNMDGLTGVTLHDAAGPSDRCIALWGGAARSPSTGGTTDLSAGESIRGSTLFLLLFLRSAAAMMSPLRRVYNRWWARNQAGSWRVSPVTLWSPLQHCDHLSPLRESQQRNPNMAYFKTEIFSKTVVTQEGGGSDAQSIKGEKQWRKKTKNKKQVRQSSNHQLQLLFK